MYILVGEYWFQSRAGFSECLDPKNILLAGPQKVFQSRAGFSECLDIEDDEIEQPVTKFQSRAGFSECLDPRSTRYSTSN